MNTDILAKFNFSETSIKYLFKLSSILIGADFKEKKSYIMFPIVTHLRTWFP